MGRLSGGTWNPSRRSRAGSSAGPSTHAWGPWRGCRRLSRCSRGRRRAGRARRWGQFQICRTRSACCIPVAAITLRKCANATAGVWTRTASPLIRRRECARSVRAREWCMSRRRSPWFRTRRFPSTRALSPLGPARGWGRTSTILSRSSASLWTFRGETSRGPTGIGSFSRTSGRW